MTEGQEDLMLAIREVHNLSDQGKYVFELYVYMATQDGWWNEKDNDFTFEDFMGIAFLNEMGTEDEVYSSMLDAAKNQLWMDARKGGGHDAYCKNSPCYAGAMNYLNQSQSFWGRYQSWKSSEYEFGSPNLYGVDYDEHRIGTALLTYDVSRISYNPDVAYNWGNDNNWAEAIKIALNGSPIDSIQGYEPSQIVYFNPYGDFVIFTIGLDAYWR